MTSCVKLVKTVVKFFRWYEKQAQEAIKDEAERSGNYYINQRWLGGTLTNFGTIQNVLHV